MINLNLNKQPSSQRYIQKKEYVNEFIKLKPPLSKDSVCFTAGLRAGTLTDNEFKSVLDEQLVSEPRPTFESDLKAANGIISYDLAKTRISSLSRYLKEDMIGFIVPEYELNVSKSSEPHSSHSKKHFGTRKSCTRFEQKGGYQWFEQGAEYLIRGSKRRVKPEAFKTVAKELYGLLALHDNYWRSPEFVDYLSTLKQSPYIEATILAVKELNNPDKVSHLGAGAVPMCGYFSPMKTMDKLLKDGCAYTGEKFEFADPNDKNAKILPSKSVSIEHITPKSWGGPSDDANYFLVSEQANVDRGRLGLIQYLKGACC